LTPQELERRACHGNEQITSQRKGHEKADERRYVLVINHLSQASHIPKQEATKIGTSELAKRSIIG
jgi:hypothetical protein